MRVVHAGRALLAVLATLVAIGSAPAPAAGQGGPGFLFKRPVASVSLRGGISLPRAQSDIFDFTRRELTVRDGDFDGSYFGAELAVPVAERWEVAFGVGYSKSSILSEYRDWVDQDDSPIQQGIRYNRTPITLSGKYYLVERGRAIGRFAWIPSRLTPFVGAGVGVVRHEFEQAGDFVDFTTFEVAFDQLRSVGYAPTVHALAGVDLTVLKQMFLTGEVRYAWASGTLDRQFFEGFDKMDLTGLQLTVGISARF